MRSAIRHLPIGQRANHRSIPGCPATTITVIGQAMGTHGVMYASAPRATGVGVLAAPVRWPAPDSVISVDPASFLASPAQNGGTPVRTLLVGDGTYPSWWTALDLVDGTHAITATSIDDLGQVSPPATMVPVVVDTVPPEQPTLDPLPAYQQEFTITLRWSGEDPAPGTGVSYDLRLSIPFPRAHRSAWARSSERSAVGLAGWGIELRWYGHSRWCRSGRSGRSGCSSAIVVVQAT